MERDAYITDMYTQRVLQINTKKYIQYRRRNVLCFFFYLNLGIFPLFHIDFKPLTIIVIQRPSFIAKLKCNKLNNKTYFQFLFVTVGIILVM